MNDGKRTSAAVNPDNDDDDDDNDDDDDDDQDDDDDDDDDNDDNDDQDTIPSCMLPKPIASSPTDDDNDNVKKNDNNIMIVSIHNRYDEDNNDSIKYRFTC